MPTTENTTVSTQELQKIITLGGLDTFYNKLKECHLDDIVDEIDNLSNTIDANEEAISEALESIADINTELGSIKSDIAELDADIVIGKGTGENSAVLKGGNNQATNANEVALGKYNISNSDTHFSIGIGNSSERKNAFEVKHNGDIYINGLTLPLATLLSTADSEEDVDSVWDDIINDIIK